MTRWFKQKSAQNLSKMPNLEPKVKTPKKGEKTTDLNKSEYS
jgi:hypothetical protein